jgi:hypothetical protein
MVCAALIAPLFFGPIAASGLALVWEWMFQFGLAGFAGHWVTFVVMWW